MLTCQYPKCIILAEVKGMDDTSRFYDFTMLISSAYKLLRRAQEKYTRLFGLRSVHVAAMLQLLSEPEGLTATELSERCGVDRAQISRVVSELERDGLTGEACPGEKRRYRGRLRLTEAGARKAEAMNALVAEKLNAVAGDLNPYDVQTFYKVLRQINERLEGV